MGPGFEPLRPGPPPGSATRVLDPGAKPGRRDLRRRSEGLRGDAARLAVAVRYATYFAVVVASTVVAKASFAAVPGARSGGMWLLLSASFQLATAAAGTMFLANRRPEIVEQLKAYLFGYTLAPGVGVAVFMWAASRITPSTQDRFLAALQAALPWIYFIPVVLPAVLFVKMVAGYRTVQRVEWDDEELMQILTRADGLMR